MALLTAPSFYCSVNRHSAVVRDKECFVIVPRGTPRGSGGLANQISRTIARAISRGSVDILGVSGLPLSVFDFSGSGTIPGS